MSRIAQRFDALKAKNRKALIPYFTAGDPDPGSPACALDPRLNQDQDRQR
jgi:tryptophan synthase alpha subunit